MDDLTERIATALTLDLEILWLSGMCPVQAEGLVNGQEFYFRARGSSWLIEIYPPGLGFVTGHMDERTWRYMEPYGLGDAGYMPESVARACIHQAAVRWAARG